MPILVIIMAVIAAASLGFLATAVPHYFLIVLVGCAVLSLFAFTSPKLSLLILLFSMLLSPEIGFGSITTSRSVVLRYDDIILVVIFMSWFARTAIQKGKAFVTETPVQTPVLIYTSLCVISTALGVIRGDVRFQVSFFYVLKYVEYFLLYFMAVNIFESKADIKKYLLYGLLIAVIVTVYAYYFYYNSGSGARATAPFETEIGKPGDAEPASLGGYYIILFGILLSMLTEYSGRIFIAVMGLFAFIFPAFLFTFSRASYIGLIGMFLASLFLAGKRRVFLGFFMTAGVMAALLLPGVSGQVRERVIMTFKGVYAVNPVETAFGTVKLEESAWLRVQSLRTVLLEKLPRHPLLGWGVTGIGFGDTQYSLIIGELGVAGTFVFFWMLYRIFGTARKVYKKFDEPWIRAISLGIMLAIVGLLFQSVGVNTFIIVRIMEPFWFLTAMIMALYRIGESEESNALKREALPQ